jgi:hypothetical protein
MKEMNDIENIDIYLSAALWEGKGKGPGRLPRASLLGASVGAG